MSLDFCPTCLAAEYSDDPRKLCRWQAVKLGQQRDEVLRLQLVEVENRRLRERVAELESIAEKLNRRVAGRRKAS